MKINKALYIDVINFLNRHSTIQKLLQLQKEADQKLEIINTLFKKLDEINATETKEWFMKEWNSVEQESKKELEIIDIRLGLFHQQIEQWVKEHKSTFSFKRLVQKLFKK